MNLKATDWAQVAQKFESTRKKFEAYAVDIQSLLKTTV
jgi:hypothetical protein